MRLLADENIPLDTIRAPRSAGHDVYSATEHAPGATDMAHGVVDGLHIRQRPM